MSVFTALVLPQNDTPQNRATREAELAAQQARYQYDYPTLVAGLPMAAAPLSVELSVDWVLDVAQIAISVGENLVDVLLPNIVPFDVQIPLTLGGSSTASPPVAPPRGADVGLGHLDPRVGPEGARKAIELHTYLSTARTKLGQIQGAAPVPGPVPRRAALDAGVQAFAAEGGSGAAPAADAFSFLKGLVEKILEFIGGVFGIYGRATDPGEYGAQFRVLPLPWPAAVYQTDEMFAQMRVAGPNPVTLERATLADVAKLALDDATYARVTGQPDATVAGALAAGALYLVDYAALTALVPGTLPLPKFVFAPRALFYVPASGRRSLLPVAIQTAQATGSPVFFPGDGAAWEVAKILVNSADGNDHELIRHLGLTHLLTEPFVLATYRQLDAQHPLNVLLAPHFAGTLLINYAALAALIEPGGVVDKLFMGTIESSNGVAATAVKAVSYNASFFPDTLVARGVADAAALPDYPYRDDALALWQAIHGWVGDYVSLYYSSDQDVQMDYELQAWVQELAGAGKIQDIGEAPAGAPARIATRAYLARLVTQVIFTASVQHAAVNFPQRTIMGFTPAMPLAVYAAFPAAADQPATQELDVLPPLQQALLQQALGTVLGGVQHTALGQYDGQLAVVQVEGPLLRFQQRLREIEGRINAANHLGARTPYATLLPSLIPQSINI